MKKGVEIFLIIMIVFLFLVSFCSVGYIFYDKSKGSDVESPSTPSNSVLRQDEVLSSKNESLTYNNQEHQLKVDYVETVLKSGTDSSPSYNGTGKYKVYLDNNLVDTIDAWNGAEDTAYDDIKFMRNMKFDVFNDKYLMIFYEQNLKSSPGFYANFYGDGKVLKTLAIVSPDRIIEDSTGKKLTTLENVKIVDSTISYYDACSFSSKNCKVGEENSNCYEVSLVTASFDGVKVDKKVVNTVKGLPNKFEEESSDLKYCE